MEEANIHWFVDVLEGNLEVDQCSVLPHVRVNYLHMSPPCQSLSPKNNLSKDRRKRLKLSLNPIPMGHLSTCLRGIRVQKPAYVSWGSGRIGVTCVCDR